MISLRKLFTRAQVTGRILSRRPQRRANSRLNGVESMEPRCVLTVPPIQVGMVYFELDDGADDGPDLLQLTFSGGAEGTQLRRITINGDKHLNGLSFGDMIFDTKSGGLGADKSHDFRIGSAEGVGQVVADVEDGSTVLTIDFEGFFVGDTLSFYVDVDEILEFDPNETNVNVINEGIDPIASGAEFQGTWFIAEFTAPHFDDISESVTFRNRYDEALLASGLDLPEDDFDGMRARSAGAFAKLQQRAVPASLSGFVYHDRNNNGLRESGEEGIGGVPIQIIPVQTVDLQEIVTITTRADGSYAVSGLMPGTYRIVQVTQPAGFLDGQDAAGTVDGLPSGIASNDEIHAIFLGGGARGSEYNFGELLPVAIRGQVHLSTPDGDCFDEDFDHEPVAGVRILLLDEAGNTIDETVTDDEGRYAFHGLFPGTYGIVEITPVGLINGGTRVGTVNGSVTGVRSAVDTVTQIVLASGQTGIGYDFCEHVPAALSGIVYHDVNNNGRRELGESGISGVTLSLIDQNGVKVAEAQTNQQGFYEFRNLRAGIYTISETHPTGWRDGTDSAGKINGQPVGRAVNPGDEIGDVRLRWGDTGIEYNFAEYLPSSLQGRVHLTSGNDDCFDVNAHHEPIAGAVVRLFDQRGILISQTITNVNGEYQFSGLDPGTYTIVEITPASLYDGGARAGVVDGRTNGRTVDGGRIVDIQLVSGQMGTNYDFCERPPADLSGFVYHDRNENARRDAQEEGIAGVIVQLRDSSGRVVAETTTEAHGAYKFTNLRAGIYDVVQTHPQGWLDGQDAVGVIQGRHEGSRVSGQADVPGDALRRIELRWGDTGVEFNFGEILPGSISGRIHADLVLDCIFNPADGEYLLEGVVVQLRDSAGNVIGSTSTDANGAYRFDGLVPGRYQVFEVQPLGFFNGGNTWNNSDSDLVTVSVGSGQLVRDVDFCEIPPALISGFVFHDGNVVVLEHDEELPEDISQVRNGKRTADDKPIPGVIMELRNGITGVVVTADSALPGLYPAGPIRTTTDTHGRYGFAGLRPGTYAVYQNQPESFVDGVDTPGSTSGFAINRGQVVPQVVLQTLTVDPQFDAIVRITVRPGVQSVENNFSEIVIQRLDPPPPPEPPPPPPWIPKAPPTPLPPPPELPVVEGLYFADVAPRKPWLYDPLGDGSDSSLAHSWHLSVVNAGEPRGDGVVVDEQPTIWLTKLPERFSTPHGKLQEGRWRIVKRYGLREKAESEILFGLAGGIPIAGDFNGDGFDEIGIYFKGEWFVDINGNGEWDSEDLWARLGDKDDYPVVGDWDGDGKDDIGIYGRAWKGDARAIVKDPGLPDRENTRRERPKNLPPEHRHAASDVRLMQRSMCTKTRADLIDHVFQFGRSSDQPIVGDWNGDGISSIGVFRNGLWLLDVDGDGSWTKVDAVVRFGRKGDVAVVGDWNGDGVHNLGVYRQGLFILDTNGNQRIDVDDERIRLGDENDTPVTGDWDGDGKDDVGVYQTVNHDAAPRVARKAG